MIKKVVDRYSSSVLFSSQPRRLSTELQRPMLSVCSQIVIASSFISFAVPYFYDTPWKLRKNVLVSSVLL